MEPPSLLCSRKSSETSPGETESSGSVSSHSERDSDDKDASRSTPDHVQSPKVSSNVASCEEHDTIKILTDKLSAALSNIRAKEDLVKQHAKVAEDAVSGWEKAEIEVSNLKQQLETTIQKNIVLEDRISQLDGALKECVRQLRQAREEHEQRFHDELVKKTGKWEAEKIELESRVVELESLMDTKVEASATMKHEFQLKLGALGKENSNLKLELLSQYEQLRIQTLEKELSIQAAETASKQHLESIKKMAKLKAECRRLRSMTHKTQSCNDNRIFANSNYMESLTDSHSDSGERMLALDNEPSCSDSWASTLIAELDQFKGEKNIRKSVSTSSVEIDLMDDFLEMERLAALPEVNHSSPIIEQQVDSDPAGSDNFQSKAELEIAHKRAAELEETVERMEGEKVELEIILVATQERLEMSSNQLKDTEDRLLELQRQLDSAYASKQVSEMEVEASEAKREALEAQLEVADLEVQQLREKVGLLEAELEKERVVAEEFSVKCQKLEDELSRRKREAELRRPASTNGDLKIKQERELAVAAGKLAECQKTIASLGQQLKSLASVEDFMSEGEKLETWGSPVPKAKESRKFNYNGSLEAAGSPLLSNGKEKWSSSSPSSSFSSSFAGFPRSPSRSIDSGQIEYQ